MSSLWEVIGAAMGFPPLDRPIPNRRSPIWEKFCKNFEAITSSPDLLDGRGPHWLYRKLHSTTPPDLTWRTLLG